MSRTVPVQHFLRRIIDLCLRLLEFAVDAMMAHYREHDAVIAPQQGMADSMLGREASTLIPIFWR